MIRKIAIGSLLLSALFLTAPAEARGPAGCDEPASWGDGVTYPGPVAPGAPVIVPITVDNYESAGPIRFVILVTGQSHNSSFPSISATTYNIKLVLRSGEHREFTFDIGPAPALPGEYTGYMLTRVCNGDEGEADLPVVVV